MSQSDGTGLNAQVLGLEDDLVRCYFHGTLFRLKGFDQRALIGRL
jgi:hypothetical protein